MQINRTGIVVIEPLDFLSTSRLKRDMLLFDKLAVDPAWLDAPRKYAEFLCAVHNIDPKVRLNAFDAFIRNLEHQGQLRVISLHAVPLSDEQETLVDKAQHTAERALSEAQSKGPYNVKLPDGSSSTIDPLGTYNLYRTNAELIRARAAATYLSTLSEYMTPLFSGPFAGLFPTADQAETVLRVVLHNFPSVADETPLEEILEFQRDPKTRELRSLMRSWMSDAAKSIVGPQAIQDRIDSLVVQNEEHMRFHRLKTTTTTIEMVLTTVAAVLGDTISLQWGEAAKKVFDVIKGRTQLSEEELKAPGRELGLITAAKKMLTNRQ